MKRFFAGCMAAVFLMAPGCSGKSGSKEGSDTATSQTTSSTVESQEDTSETKEVSESSDTSESEPASDPADTSDTDVPGTDVVGISGNATLTRYREGGDQEEIPLEEYKSGTDPVYVQEGRYESSGMVSREMANAEREYRSLITNESFWNITKDLNLPSEINGISTTWISSDESLIKSTGKVHRPHDRSQFVILTVIFSDAEGSITCRESLRVARDMYDGVDVRTIPTMDEYVRPEMVGEYYPQFKDTEGGWFLFTDPGDVFFFDPDPDNMMVYDQCGNGWNSYLIGGQISDARVDSEKEAHLCIATLKRVFHFEDIFDNLVFTGTIDSLGDVVYDYAQYYQGVRVQSGFVRVMSSYRRPYVTVNICLVNIPSGFSATPKVSEDYVIREHDLYSAELSIMNDNGSVRLVYVGYRNGASEQVLVDAKTGNEIASYSTIMT